MSSIGSRILDPCSESLSELRIFRGSNPKLWGTDTDNELGFARKLSTLPKDTKFLAMRNGNSTVIIPVTYEQLTEYVEVGGGVKWNGTAYFDGQTLSGKNYESFCLGIGTKKMYRKSGEGVGKTLTDFGRISGSGKN